METAGKGLLAGGGGVESGRKGAVPCAWGTSGDPRFHSRFPVRSPLAPIARMNSNEVLSWRPLYI